MSSPGTAIKGQKVPLFPLLLLLLLLRRRHYKDTLRSSSTERDLGSHTGFSGGYCFLSERPDMMPTSSEGGGGHGKADIVREVV